MRVRADCGRVVLVVSWFLLCLPHSTLEKGGEGKTYIMLAEAPVLEELGVLWHQHGAVVDVVVRLEEAAGTVGGGGRVDGAGELRDGGGDARHGGGRVVDVV